MQQQRRARAGDTRKARARAIAPFASLTLVAYPLVAIDSVPMKTGFVVASLAVMEVYASWFMGLPWWGAVLVLAVAGALWFFPAAWMVRWMARPD